MLHSSKLFILLLALTAFIFVHSAPLSEWEEEDKSLLEKRRQKTQKKPTYTIQSPQQQNPTDAFCVSFVKQCYHEALNGRRGEITVQFYCERNGGKYSSSFTFGCKADGIDLTNSVLNEISGGYTVTVTQQGSTDVITGTITDIKTQTSTTTQEVDLTTTQNTTKTKSKTTTSINTQTTTQSTVLTTVIPITTTTTSLTTQITTIPSTTYVTATTYTSISLQNEAVPIVRVSLTPAKGRKRMNQVDSSQFCNSFNTGCQQQCSNVRSTPKHVVCENTGTFQYSLTCYCKNGKVETQHALAAAVNQEHIVSVSTVTTSTTYATVTSTTFIPTTVLSTSYATVTSTKEVTSTFTSLSTTTQTTIATGFTGSSVPITTITPISTILSTATPTVTATSTTTQIIVAPTGAVEMYYEIGDYDNSFGYLAANTNGSSLMTYTTDLSEATQFLAIVDPETRLIQLQFTDGSGNVVIGQDVHSESDGGYVLVTYGEASSCDAAANQPHSPSGEGPNYEYPCETFIFSGEYHSLNATQQSNNSTNNTISSSNSTDGFLILHAEFYQVDATEPTDYTWYNFQSSSSATHNNRTITHSNHTSPHNNYTSPHNNHTSPHNNHTSPHNNRTTTQNYDFIGALVDATYYDEVDDGKDSPDTPVQFRYPITVPNNDAESDDEEN